MISEKRKQYLKNWWKNNKDKKRKYDKTYKLRHPDKIREKERRRRLKPERIEYMINYKKEYTTRPYVKRKHYIRSRTNRIYGKTPKGYQKHHLDYNTPHNFILVEIEEHIKIHKNNVNKQ